MSGNFNIYVKSLFLSTHCAHCNCTIGVNSLLDSPIKCPACTREMIATFDTHKTQIVSMVCCKKCGTTFGTVSFLDDPPKCPTCEAPCTP